MTHPIRQAEVHTFQRHNSNGKGREWIAQFYPYSIYPVFFIGPTEAGVVEQAEGMRAEAIEKHEAACIARQQAKEKAAAARAKKQAAQ